MRLFGALYSRALTWARDPRAVYYLCGLSFVEAFIFPIMPEVMLAPMMLGKRQKAFFYANVSLRDEDLALLDEAVPILVCVRNKIQDRLYDRGTL